MDLRGPGIVCSLFFACFLFEKFGNLTPTIHLNNTFEYIPILTANIYADLVIIFLTFTKLIYHSTSLETWYTKYHLSGMIADILIGVLYILLARYIVSTLKLNVGLTFFALLAVGIQIIFDLLFYILFTFISKGSNHILDFFKMYASEVKENALYGDSALVIFAVILSAILNKQSFDFNMIALIISIYLVPYFIYMKD